MARAQISLGYEHRLSSEKIRILGHTVRSLLGYGRILEFMFYVLLIYSILTPQNYFVRLITPTYSEAINYITSFIVSLIFSSIIVVLPLKIFSVLPIEAMFRTIYKRYIMVLFPEEVEPLETFETRGREQTASAGGEQHTRRTDPRAQLDQFAAESGKIAQRIYSRAGAYLLGGVVIAFVGLGIFITRPAIDLEQHRDIWDRLIDLAPNFGILFLLSLSRYFF